ncbi:MAG: N-acetylglucosamine-6-phosphate deacetylase [Rhodospirillales bacterium]|nr:N-acetylglucosamine-6-phosphate deacetylase [Rhodospirillales bacterium]
MADGLVDLQVNGYAGVDFNDAGLTAAALDRALGAMRADGVAVCLPTLITAAPDALAARFAALDRAVATSTLGPAMVPGYHLEGPFLSPEPGYAGCHPAAFMQPGDPALVAALEAPLARKILLVTVAPERPGVPDVIRWAARRGKLVALGHTAADPPTIAAAVAAGARLCTHLGNALPSPQPKFANPLFAQLAEDGLAASFIADGIHVPPFALKAMLRAKGIDRAILVTDATAGAAAPAGQYRLGDLAIERGVDGAVRLPGIDRLAGSALVLADAVRNLIAWGIATGAEAARMAGANPTALLAPALAAHGRDFVLPA